MAKASRQKRLGQADLRSRIALTVAEASAALGVSERHLRSLLHELPHVYLGSKPVIPIDSLREWLRQQAAANENGVDSTVEDMIRGFEPREGTR